MTNRLKWAARRARAIRALAMYALSLGTVAILGLPIWLLVAILRQ